MTQKFTNGNTIVRFRQNLMDRLPYLRALLHRRHIHREVKRQLNLLQPYSKLFECDWEDTWPNRRYRVRPKCEDEALLPKFAFNFHASNRTLNWRIECELGIVYVDSLPLWGLLNFFGYILALKPQAGDVIIDIGAYNGLTAVLFGLLVKKDGWVLALEPQKHNATRTRQAISASGLAHIEFLQIGVDSDKGIMNMSSKGTASALSQYYSPGATAVNVMAFDDVINLASSRYPNQPIKVKLDVEGTELRMVHAFIKSLQQKDSNRIAIASYHMVDGIETREVIEEHCKQTSDILCQTLYPLHQTTVLRRTTD